jgi:hypothetical protein
MEELILTSTQTTKFELRLRLIVLYFIFIFPVLDSRFPESSTRCWVERWEWDWKDGTVQSMAFILLLNSTKAVLLMVVCGARAGYKCLTYALPVQPTK